MKCWKTNASERKISVSSVCAFTEVQVRFGFLCFATCHSCLSGHWALQLAQPRHGSFCHRAAPPARSAERQTSAPAFSSHKNHQQTKGIQRRGLDRAIQCRDCWVNAPDSPTALEALLQRGTMSTHVWNTMHIAWDAQLAITILLLLSRAEASVLGALAPFPGAFLPLCCALRRRNSAWTRELTGVKQEWAGQAHALPPNVSSNSHFCLPNTANIPWLYTQDPGSPEAQVCSPVSPHCLDSQSRSRRVPPALPLFLPRNCFGASLVCQLVSL